MKAKAAVVREAGKPFQIEVVDIAEPKKNEVLVKIIASGVCHTDEAGRQGGFVPFPAVLGHEGAGIVEKVGSGVTTVQKGDHVVLTYASCGECKLCIAKKPFVCTDFNALNIGGKLRDGTSRISIDGKEINNFFGQSSFAAYAVTDIHNVVKVDKDVDITLLGPLGCGIQTGAGTVLSQLGPEPGSSIAIFGIGALGLSGIMAAKIVGCKTIIAVGGTPEKLKLALELGATHTVNRKEVGDVPGAIKGITGGGVNYSLDTSGAPVMMQYSLRAMADLGKAAWVGIGPEVTVSPYDMGANKSVGYYVEGSVDPQVFIPQMISYYKQGKFPFDRLIKFYELEDIDKAFKESQSGLVVKPIIKMPQ
jgi:aryl-alcohol dehydrogenase